MALMQFDLTSKKVKNECKDNLIFSAYPDNPRRKINELDFTLAQKSLCSSRDWKQGTKARWRIMVEEEDESVYPLFRGDSSIGPT